MPRILGSKFMRLLGEVRQEIMERIQTHKLYCLQVKSVYDNVDALLKLSREPFFPMSLKDGSLGGTCHDRLIGIEPAVKIITEDHAGIVQAVIDFNKIVLSSGEQYKEQLIVFDKDTVVIFADVKEELLAELPPPVKRKYTKRETA